MTIGEKLEQLRIAKLAKQNNPQNSPCKCGVMNWKVGYALDSLGRTRYPYYCVKCGYRTCRYIKEIEVNSLGYKPLEAIGDINQQKYK